MEVEGIKEWKEEKTRQAQQRNRRKKTLTKVKTEMSLLRKQIKRNSNENNDGWRKIARIYWTFIMYLDAC